MFVTVQEVPVTVGENTVIIKSKMDLATSVKVETEFTKIIMDGGITTKDKVTAREKMVLLVHNVVGWSGPSFGNVKFAPAVIGTLDPEALDMPLWDTVLQEIDKRNTKRTDPTPEDWPENGQVKKKVQGVGT